MVKQTLSLKLWLLVLLLVTACVILFSNLDYSTNSTRVFFNLERIKEHKRPHLIIMGTSLVRCGFPFDSLLEKKLSEAGINSQITRITRSGQDASWFKPILSDIIKSKPDMLFIQDAYFINYQKNKKSSYLTRYRQFIFHLIARITHSVENTRENYGVDGQHCLQVDESYSNSDMQAMLLVRQYESWNYQLRTHDEISYLYEFINALKKNGTQVIFFEMGRSKTANDHLGKEKLLQITQSLELLSNATNMPYWRFPANLTMDYYTDFSHLNAKGQLILTQWFIDSLQNHLQNYENSR